MLIAFADTDLLDAVVDGGRVPGGTASSLVDLTADPPRLLRDGPISRAELEARDRDTRLTAKCASPSAPITPASPSRGSSAACSTSCASNIGISEPSAARRSTIPISLHRSRARWHGATSSLGSCWAGAAPARRSSRTRCAASAACEATDPVIARLGARAQQRQRAGHGLAHRRHRGRARLRAGLPDRRVPARPTRRAHREDRPH